MAGSIGVGEVTLTPLIWHGEFSHSRERKGKTIVILFIMGAGNPLNSVIKGKRDYEKSK